MLKISFVYLHIVHMYIEYLHTYNHLDKVALEELVKD